MTEPALPPSNRPFSLSRFLLSIFVPAVAVLGGIWGAAIWTSSQENRVGRVEDRVTAVEKKTDGTASNEARVGQLEYRLNWMDEEKNRDRNERRQIDRDIREALDRLNSVVIRLEANEPYKRRR